MSAAFVNATTAADQTGTGTTLALTLPASLVVGDVLIVAFTVPGNRTLTAEPTGLTPTPPGQKIAGSGSSGGDCLLKCYTRIIDGTEPTTYSWTVSSAARMEAVALHYSGEYKASPINVAAYTVQSTGNAAIVAPTAKPTVKGVLAVRIAALNGNGTGAALSADTPLVLRAYPGNSLNAALIAAEDPAAITDLSAAPTRGLTSTAAGRSVAQTLLLWPDGSYPSAAPICQGFGVTQPGMF